MFRHEWYKLWHSRRLVAVFLLLAVVNCAYFVYRAANAAPKASEYRQLASDIRGMSDATAAEYLEREYKSARAPFYGDGTEVIEKNYPVYCKSLWTEMSLYEMAHKEYLEVINYPEYVGKILKAPATYRLLQSFYREGNSSRELLNVERTAKDYEPLAELTLQHTRTKGISEALALPSLIFLEILLAVLYMTVVLSREKEQDLLSLYATMPNGRTRLIFAKFGAVALGITVSNLVLLGTTILTGCLLYGMPDAGDWTQPLQALVGYKSAALSVSILGFLLLVYLGSLLVSLWFAVLTALLTVVFASSRAVYLVMFLLVGIEGILYLRIDDLSYLAKLRRVNVVAFADVPERLGRYRNIYVFGTPVGEWKVGAAVLLITGVLGVAVIVCCVARGVGMSVRKRAAKRLLAELAGRTRRGGAHGFLFLHEAYKYLRLERVGLVLLALVLWVLLFTNPYGKSYTIEDMHYESFLLQLQEVSKEEYAAKVAGFRADFEKAAQSADPSTLSERREALEKIEAYAAYLEPLDGATAVNEKGYELLYNDTKQNIVMGAASLLLVILCGTSLYYIEYRTGMHEMIRISYVGRVRVHVWKLVLLFLSALLIFAAIYGRHVFRVTRSYGTVGIGSAAYSIQDLRDISSWLSLRGFLILTYVKRFAGLLLGAAVSVLVIRKVRSFLFAALGSMVILVGPLLLGLFDSGLLRNFLFNWFFLR
ncbi:MAG: ABC transporter permease [Lachnospiraceae bacterium]|nr:ABC transporter permease [Lachnospiraceae bacterium]